MEDVTQDDQEITQACNCLKTCFVAARAENGTAPRCWRYSLHLRQLTVFQSHQKGSQALQHRLSCLFAVPVGPWTMTVLLKEPGPWWHSPDRARNVAAKDCARCKGLQAHHPGCKQRPCTPFSHPWTGALTPAAWLQEDSWAVISAFFAEKSLVRQQLDSFNDFVNSSMQASPAL